MEQRVSLITLGVADLARARRFYEEGLGWQPGFAADDVVFFPMAGMVFALFSRNDLAEDARIPLERFGVGSPALAHNLRSREEVDATLREAAAAGATILKEAADTSWGGYSGYFADPDGHPWEIAWNPGWVLSTDGGVSLK
jgi:catechol 2,3-dioxygenase-like lactoylglutathione lyase family enzyme